MNKLQYNYASPMTLMLYRCVFDAIGFDVSKRMKFIRNATRLMNIQGQFELHKIIVHSHIIQAIEKGRIDYDAFCVFLESGSCLISQMADYYGVHRSDLKELAFNDRLKTSYLIKAILKFKE